MASLVQFKTANATTSTASIDVTFDSTPTEGNLIVAAFFTRSTTRSLASGYNEAVFVDNPAQKDQASIAYKIAGASESATTTWGGSPSDTHGVVIMEFAPTSGYSWDSSPFDQSASTGRTANATSLSSGTTGTLSSADSIAVAMIGLRDGSTGSFSWTNSFTEVGNTASGGALAQSAASWKDLSATTAVETTASWTSSLTVMGLIATFTESVSGGGTAALTGSASTSGQGNVTSNLSYALTGSAVTSNQGDLSTDTSQSLTGEAVTSSQGDLSETVSYELTGEAVTVSQGDVTDASTADVTRSLSGEVATSALGDYIHGIDYAISGEQISSSQGSFTYTVNQNISGEAVSVDQGTITETVTGNVTAALTGNAVTSSLGDLTRVGGQLVNVEAGVGSSSRNRRLTKRYVKVDNKKQWFESEEELLKILDQAKQSVERVARKAVRTGYVDVKQQKAPVIEYTPSKLADFTGIQRRIDEINSHISKTFNDLVINEIIRREEEEELEVIRLVMQERKELANLIKEIYVR